MRWTALEQLMNELENRNRDLQAQLNGSEAVVTALKLENVDLETKIENLTSKLDRKRVKLASSRQDLDKVFTKLGESELDRRQSEQELTTV